MKRLAGFKELYEYLGFLASALRERGSEDLIAAVDHARHCSASNISTEFLGESRIALRRVLVEGKGVLTEQEHVDLSEVLKQIDAALDGPRQ